MDDTNCRCARGRTPRRVAGRRHMRRTEGADFPLNQPALRRGVASPKEGGGTPRSASIHFAGCRPGPSPTRKKGSSLAERPMGAAPCTPRVKDIGGRLPARAPGRAGGPSPYFLRCRIRLRIRRFFRPTLRRPFPRRRLAILTPVQVANGRGHPQFPQGERFESYPTADLRTRQRVRPPGPFTVSRYPAW
jgi:hypothetical protein